MQAVRPHRSGTLGRWFEDLRHDLRFAQRQLRKTPGFAALVAGTLAIGIGANATMAGAIDRLLLRPPPHVKDPDRVLRLVRVGTKDDGTPWAGTGEPFTTYLDIKREAPAFELVAGYFATRMSLGTGPDAIEVHATLVSDGFFQVFGVSAATGRFFSPDDGYPQTEVSGGPALAVLGYDFWLRQFAGDSAMVGRRIRVGSASYTVVGVAPRGFRGVEIEPPDLWLPVNVAGNDFPLYWTAGRNALWFSLVARLREGATNAAASQQATATWRRQEQTRAFPDTVWRYVAAPVVRGRGADAPREVNVVLWLGGVSALVLLIACANVANMLLGRAFARRREIAVRLAVGAGGGRLVRQLLAESMLLSLLGATGAIWLTVAAGKVLPRLFVTDLSEPGFVDVRLFAFTALVALACGTLLSLTPLFQARSLDLTSALRVGAAVGGGRTSRIRSLLLGVQAALCMVMLVAASLFALSLGRVQNLDLGLDPERTWRIRFDMNRALMPVRTDYEVRSGAMLERVAAVPGVSRAALEVSLGAFAPWSDLTREGTWWERASRAGFLTAVDSGYFRTLGAASLLGRDIDASDHAGAARVAVVTAPLARVLWPGREAIGQCLYYRMFGGDRGDCVRVVGVVGGSWGRDILDRGNLGAYIPLAQRASQTQRPGVLYVRITGDAATTVPAVRRAVQEVHPGMAAAGATRMSDFFDPQIRPWRLAAVLFGVFGGVALVIAVIGLYGVVAFATAQRSTEVAVRVALGARGRHVLSVVAGSGLRAVSLGLIAGTAAALALRGALGPLLFQTSPDDPRVIGGMAALLLGTAALAGAIPVVRILRRNPASVLRVD
jgi:predicted permease